MEDAFLFRHGLSPSRRRPDVPGAAQTIPALLNAGVMERSEHDALVGAHARFSYEGLMLASQRAAMTLVDWGVAPGDRVAASLPNETEMVVAFLATMRIGAVFVGIPQTFPLEDQLEVLRETEATLLLADQGSHDLLMPSRASLRDLRQVVVAEPGASEWNLAVDREEDLAPFDDVDPFAPALIAYGRDADGRPRGIVHSQHNLLLPGTVAFAEHQVYGERLGVCSPLSDVDVLVRGPLRAFQGLGCCVLKGADDSRELAAWARDEDLHSLAAGPSDIDVLLAESSASEEALAHLDSVELLADLAEGTEGIPDALQERYRKRFGRNATLGTRLPEAPAAVTGGDPEAGPPVGSHGRALPHLELAILGDDDRELPDGEVGRIGLRPARHGRFADAWTPMLGYWNRPDATRAALHGGTLRTGARGRVDAEGHLFLAS